MHCVILLLCPLQSGECGPGMDMGVSGDTEDRELEAALVEDGNDILVNIASFNRLSLENLFTYIFCVCLFELLIYRLTMNADACTERQK